jgi:hypothetical protein
MKTIMMLLMATFSIITIDVFSQEKAGKKDTSSHTTYYTCPMHDSVLATKSGYCPVCGMKLQLSKKEQMKNETVKNFTCPVHPDIMSKKAGKCPKCGSPLALSKKEQMKAETMKVYTCPMHSDVTADKPGKCSKCGMDLTLQKKQ